MKTWTEIEPTLQERIGLFLVGGDQHFLQIVTKAQAADLRLTEAVHTSAADAFLKAQGALTLPTTHLADWTAADQAAKELVIESLLSEGESYLRAAHESNRFNLLVRRNRMRDAAEACHAAVVALGYKPHDYLTTTLEMSKERSWTWVSDAGRSLTVANSMVMRWDAVEDIAKDIDKETLKHLDDVIAQETGQTTTKDDTTGSSVEDE